MQAVIRHRMRTAKPLPRSFLENAMFRILIANSKGGCGKTTLTTSLAGYFARSGRRTSLMDCDPQGSLTKDDLPVLKRPTTATL